MLHQTFLFLGQLWQLFEVSQILEFLRYHPNSLTKCFIECLSDGHLTFQMDLIFYITYTIFNSLISSTFCAQYNNNKEIRNNNNESIKIEINSWKYISILFIPYPI